MIWRVVSAPAIHTVRVTPLIVLILLVLLTMGTVQLTYISEQYQGHVCHSDQHASSGRAGDLYVECPLGQSVLGKVAEAKTRSAAACEG